MKKVMMMGAVLCSCLVSMPLFAHGKHKNQEMLSITNNTNSTLEFFVNGKPYPELKTKGNKTTTISNKILNELNDTCERHVKDCELLIVGKNLSTVAVINFADGFDNMGFSSVQNNVSVMPYSITVNAAPAVIQPENPPTSGTGG